MGNPNTKERRYIPARQEADSFNLLVANRRKVRLLVVAGLGFTGCVDVATGTEVWLGPMYLFVIGFAAWMLGRREAVVAGAASIAFVISANGFNFYPLGTIAAMWNLAMRILTVALSIGLLGHIRDAYSREWHLARTDPLTGALNRQAFFELAQRSATLSEWSMFAYADLDGLKKLNDECGHAAGDDCLKRFVAHVQSAIRANDHFARLGGDEFIIHLEVRDEASALMVAQRLHREMNLVAGQIHPGLCCSLGALILPPGIRMLDREIIAADQLMYEAKQQGAGLMAATLRYVRGSQFLLQHWECGLGSNAVLSRQLNHLEERELDAAA